MAVLVDRAQRLVDLDELTVGQPTDDAGLDAVLEHLAVVLLQTQADAVGQSRTRSAGATTTPIRPTHVIAFRLMSNLSAMTSLPPDIHSHT